MSEICGHLIKKRDGSTAPCVSKPGHKSSNHRDAAYLDSQRPRRRDYQQRPDVRERRQDYMQDYQQRPEVVSRRLELSQLTQNRERKRRHNKRHRENARRSTIYFWYDIFARIVYIGQTFNPDVRFRQHYCKNNHANDWFDNAAYVMEHDVPAEQLDAVEAHLIHKFHPVGNKQCPLCDAVALFTGLAALDTCEFSGSCVSVA